MEPEIPAEVTQFVRRHIASLGQLEVLLLVSALPDREWSTGEVDAVIRSHPDAVGEWLEGFVRTGVFVRTGEPPVYRYAPVSGELAQSVAKLGATYKMKRHKVVELIYSDPTDSIRDFSDAFRFKKGN